jgi:hypothetical protein
MYMRKIMLFIIQIIHVNNQAIKSAYYWHLTNLQNDFKKYMLQKLTAI